MARFGFPIPVLPGKEQLVLSATEQMNQRRQEHEESRRNAGLTLERAWLQRNPDGSSLLVVYDEAEGSFEDVVRAFVSSGSDFDRWFIEQNQEISGIDFRQPLPGGGPEHIGSWEAPGGRRGKGLAFAAPLAAGKADAGRKLIGEAFETRKQDLTESRLALRETREEVFLNMTPMGDIAVVYLEGDDPVRANREFAASQKPYDRWFKDQLKAIFPPYVDFDQPVPPNQQIFDWQRGGG
jgi:hypothetical protein